MVEPQGWEHTETTYLKAAKRKNSTIIFRGEMDELQFFSEKTIEFLHFYCLLGTWIRCVPTVVAQPYLVYSSFISLFEVFSNKIWDSFISPIQKNSWSFLFLFFTYMVLICSHPCRSTKYGTQLVIIILDGVCNKNLQFVHSPPRKNVAIFRSD